jgi:hypothetical protein
LGVRHDRSRPLVSAQPRPGPGLALGAAASGTLRGAPARCILGGGQGLFLARHTRLGGRLVG